MCDFISTDALSTRSAVLNLKFESFASIAEQQIEAAFPSREGMFAFAFCVSLATVKFHSYIANI